MNLFLFQNKYTYFESPWPHIVIDNCLPDDIAKELSDTFLEKTELWDELKNQNMNSLYKMNVLLSGIFNKDLVNVYTDEWNLNVHVASTETELIRDWHIDGLDKRYQIILYLGDMKCGQYEMKNKDGWTKTIPYKHNRLLAWYNNTTDNPTYHRFWTGDKDRHTVNMPIYRKK